MTLSSTDSPGNGRTSLERAADAAPAHHVGREPVDPLAGERDGPPFGGNTPAIMLNSVVLPAPFGPITAKITPCGTANDTSATARSPLKFLVTLATSSSAAISALRPVFAIVLCASSRWSRPSLRASGGQMPSGSSITTNSRHKP